MSSTSVGIDQRLGAGEDAARRTDQPVERVVGVDGVPDESPAQGRAPAHAPAQVEVGQLAPPVGLDRAQVNPPGNAQALQVLQALHGKPVAVVEDRHDLFAGALFGGDQRIDVRQRAARGLFNEGVFARFQRHARKRGVQVRWGGDIDHIQIVQRAQRFDIRGDARHAEFFGAGLRLGRKDIAYCRHFKTVRQVAVSQQMRAADPAAAD